MGDLKLLPNSVPAPTLNFVISKNFPEQLVRELKTFKGNASH